MLEIKVKEQRLYDENKNEFIYIKPVTLKLEHSLISIRKWESKHHKPFLGGKGDEKTLDELVDYISCMVINKENVDPTVIYHLPAEVIQKVIVYIKDDMTATWFTGNHRVGASNILGEVVTAEIIYYWMISYNVPIELERWHLNQLLTLLKVINIKNGGEKKMSKRDAAIERTAENMRRRAKYHTKG